MQQSNEKALQPLAQDLGNIRPIDFFNSANEFITSQNYSEVANLTRTGKLGASAYCFSNVIDKISQAYTQTVLSDAQTKELMLKFVKSVADNNNQQLTYYNDIRKQREQAKADAIKYHQELMKPLNDTLIRLVDLCAKGELDEKKFNTLQGVIKTQMEMANEANARHLSYTATTTEENKMYQELQLANNQLAKDLMTAMVKITKTTASTTSKVIDALVSVKQPKGDAVESLDTKKLTIEDHSTKAPAPAASKDKTHKSAYTAEPPESSKQRSYTPFVTKEDYNGKDQKQLSYKKGDTLYVYDEAPSRYKGWFKAVKNKDQHTEKGIVSPKHLKKMT